MKRGKDPVIVNVPMVDIVLGGRSCRITLEEALQLRNRLALITDKMLGLDRTAALALDLVSAAFDQSIDRILSKNRSEPLATHRNAVMWLLIEIGLTDAEAGLVLRKQRSTSKYGHKRITDLMSIDQKLNLKLLALREKLQGQINQTRKAS